MFYAYPYFFHERGTSEYFNSLLRNFLPKGQSFNTLTAENLQEYVAVINYRPRKLLGFLVKLNCWNNYRLANES